MIQIVFFLIQLAVIIFLSIISIVFIVLAIVKRKHGKQLMIYGGLAIAVIVGVAVVASIDLFSAQSTKRDANVAAFESNFGFTPPVAVKEIRVKNFGIYDSDVHWMAFTYDSTVFAKILHHDQPLDIIDRNSPGFSQIATDLKDGCRNCPKWFQLPDRNAARIYYKKSFLDHQYSDYHLWVDPDNEMVYLQVSYFD
jgi:hypothetical protein